MRMQYVKCFVISIQVDELISSTLLNVDCEEKVFSSVINWVKHEPNDRKKQVSRVRNTTSFYLLRCRVAGIFRKKKVCCNSFQSHKYTPIIISVKSITSHCVVLFYPFYCCKTIYLSLIVKILLHLMISISRYFKKKGPHVIMYHKSSFWTFITFSPLHH